MIISSCLTRLYTTYGLVGVHPWRNARWKSIWTNHMIGWSRASCWIPWEEWALTKHGYDGLKDASPIFDIELPSMEKNDKFLPHKRHLSGWPLVPLFILICGWCSIKTYYASGGHETTWRNLHKKDMPNYPPPSLCGKLHFLHQSGCSERVCPQNHLGGIQPNLEPERQSPKIEYQLHL